jgi:pSer/pThr/pTyr-binding forkhead associated (FHA) protein
MHRIRVLRRGAVVRELNFEGEVTIGRTVQNVLRLPEQAVSGQHAKLLLEDGGCYVIDLESHNGTVLDGEKIEPGTRQLLTGGERIGVGSFEITYVPPHCTESLPPGLLQAYLNGETGDEDDEDEDDDILPPSRSRTPTRPREKGNLIAAVVLVVSIIGLAAIVLGRLL